MAKDSRKRKTSRSRSPSERRHHQKRSRKRSSDRRTKSPSYKRSYMDNTKRSKRSKSKEKCLFKELTPEVKECAMIIDDQIKDKETDQEMDENKRLKMKERIEKWSAEMNKHTEETSKAAPSSESFVSKWTLDDDYDEYDECGADPRNNVGEEAGSEPDPLDVFMMSINEKVSNNEKNFQTGVSGLTKTSKDSSGENVITEETIPKPSNKGGLVESDDDSLEYFDEENFDDAMRKLSKKRKELVEVDHSKIYYRPFRKNFYIEVPEISNMRVEEVNEYRIELENISVIGKDCPKPIKTWAQCGVNKKVLECLKKNGFNRPTPIQAQALPIIMSGRDLIGIAKTGSGKTLAFLIPMFRHILDQPELEQDDGPIAIILTPTRELAMQIGKECKKFTKSLDLRVVCIYGGTGMSEQIKEVKRGAEIAVCTPGRMIELLADRITNLRRVTYLVLDEADRMFDMGFEPQVTKIVQNIRPDRMTVMFSATFPRQMEALARNVLNQPIEVTVGGRSVVCSDVEQHVIILESSQKFYKLLELLGTYQEQGSVLVFVHKQEHADELMRNLLKHSYPCLPLHGGLNQHDRDCTMEDFKLGNIKLLIATSVCSRGLDVKDLILVVNYDCPNHYEDYVHRCGRTGRAGKHGYAYTFLTPDQGCFAIDLIKALKLSKATVPDDLKKVWKNYVKDMKAQGKKICISSGFRGKGFKFDETEVDEKKKLQKAAHGIQDSDEEDAGSDIDKKIEEMLSSCKKVSGGGQRVRLESGTLSAISQEKLDMARNAASKISILKNTGEPLDHHQVVTSILPQMSSKAKVEQLAEKLHARMGYQPNSEEKNEVGPQEPMSFCEELEINDLPQNVRWKVTNMETLNQINEYSEAAVIVRGSYVPPNKVLKEGERKLFLAIEASSDLAIQKAKVEITRIIKEELLKSQSIYHPVNKSRYKVV